MNVVLKINRNSLIRNVRGHIKRKATGYADKEMGQQIVCSYFVMMNRYNLCAGKGNGGRRGSLCEQEAACKTTDQSQDYQLLTHNLLF